MTGITDAGDSALTWSYGYDSLDRLNSASKSGTTQGWTYDANGNRLSQSGTTASTYTNSSTSNRVSSISGSLSRTYAYDAAGNTLSYAGATFTYNHRGRMATATNGGVTATYTYNALGQRVKRSTSSSATLYIYDEAGHLAGEYTSAGALIQETVWLGDMPVATLRPNGSGGVILYYVHADHLNTPRLVTDTANNIRWRWDSDPFGTSLPNENPSSLGTFVFNLRFPGQQYDSVAGLNYNYYRDLDPSTGRYVESDPIGLLGGLNGYSYVTSNPLVSVDPYGLEKVILLPPGDPNYPAAVDAPDDPAVCLVIAHGNSKIVNGMNAAQLKNRLGKVCKPKQPIRLESCRTGEGENSIAEQLARLWGAEVKAPTERVWTTPWNTSIYLPAAPISEDRQSFWNSVPNWNSPGYWRTFGPNGPVPLSPPIHTPDYLIR